MIHLSDGRTLTEKDCLPHEVEDFDVKQEDITSVERVVEGRTMTIKKSDFIDTFFIASEEFIDVKMAPGPQRPPEVTKRMIGCYVKNTTPPLQCRMTMDPRTFDANLEFFRVTAKARAGINADRVTPFKKGTVIPVYNLPVADNTYSIVQSPDVGEIFPTKSGLGCLLKDPRIRAEIMVKGQNLLLAFLPPDQKLVDTEEFVDLTVNISVPPSGKRRRKGDQPS